MAGRVLFLKALPLKQGQFFRFSGLFVHDLLVHPTGDGVHHLAGIVIVDHEFRPGERTSTSTPSMEMLPPEALLVKAA